MPQSSVQMAEETSSKLEKRGSRVAIWDARGKGCLPGAAARASAQGEGRGAPKNVPFVAAGGGAQPGSSAVCDPAIKWI